MGQLCTKSTSNQSFGGTIDGRRSFCNHYTLGKLIGKGHIGEVRIAKNVVQQEFAVKCIPIQRISEELTNLKREICILREVNNPNIIKFYELYEDDQFLYITMELCSQSLAQRISAENGRMSLQDVKKLAKDVANGLIYIHELGIVHRDIKPDNILLDSYGNAKIADFGLARKYAGNGALTIVGTPYYLAPEVTQGHYDQKCDIWSLGVCIYFCLSGLLPFEGKDLNDLLFKITTQPIDFSVVPDDSKEFLRQLLQKSKKKRPSAAQVFNSDWVNS